ncbi:hypothetical protein ACFLS8_03870 [Chloroflexota bacterium]
MELSNQAKKGETSSHIAIIFVTVAQFIFFTFFHKYIAWFATAPDGTVTRLSMLTDDYFIWLPIMITASILVIVASIAMIIHDEYRFSRTIQMIFSIIGIVVAVSLVSIFPFDFSVIPNATAVDVVPTVVTVFFILLAIFYAITVLVIFVKLRRYTAKQETK